MVPSDAGPPDAGPDAAAPICEPACDNELFCDGAESCVDGSCSPGTAPCAGECDEAADRCLTDCEIAADADGDGHDAVACGGEDCDDSDPSISPDALEIAGDGIDQDCDGGESCLADADLDGVATVDVLVASADLDCDDPGEGGAMVGDCDDMDGAVHPGAVEVPGDGVDSDCDMTELCYADADGDGYRVTGGEPIVSDDLACDAPGETSAATPEGDCDDASSAHHPGAPDLAGVGGDTDCDGLELCYVDADGDGFGTMTTVSSSRLDCSGPGEAPRRTRGGGTLPSRLPLFDCNDADSTIRPDAIEVCNGVDDNCDGEVDATVPLFTRDPVPLTRSCGTSDVGACQLGTQTCVAATGTWGACTGAIGPTTERCDGSDADCDGTADEGCPCTLGMTQSCGSDVGACTLGTQTCSAAGIWGACTGGQAPITESCNGADDDCDGMTDEPGATGCVEYVRDVDGDGFAEPPGGEVRCLCAPTGAFTIRRSTATLGYADCDDGDASVNPGAPEVCDSIDHDCDGEITEVGAVGCTDYWVDADGDGYGHLSSTPTCLCAPSGVFRGTEPGDCCDVDGRAHPGVTAWFNTPMPPSCGAFNFDYNCSGSATRRWTTVGECRGGSTCTARQGWADVPSCGQAGNWLYSCARYGSFCLPSNSGPYLQECR